MPPSRYAFFKIASQLILFAGLLCGSLRAATASDFSFEQSPRYEAQALGYLPYRLYQAQGYELPGNADQTYPLIVWLHGLGERGTNNTSQLKNGVVELASDANQAITPSFIMAPQADNSSGGWASRFDAASAVTETRLFLAIEDLKSRFRIDPERIYVMGLSYGGAGTWNVVTHRPDYFAAAAPMSQPATADAQGLALLSKLPIWAYDGSNDQITKGTVSTLRGRGGRANYTIVAGGGHNATTWRAAAENPDLYRWLMDQRRQTTLTPGSLPALKITSPGTPPSLLTSASSITLSGEANLSPSTMDAFSLLRWSSSTGIAGSATGTTAWDTSSISLTSVSQLLQVTATATQNPSTTRAGTTTFNDVLMVNDTTAPTLSLKHPVSGPFYLSPTDHLTLRGSASDDFTVTQIRWANHRGGSGLAGGEFHHQESGQVNWFISDLPLSPGHNRILLEASDLSENRTEHMLHVYRPYGGGGEFFNQNFESAAALSGYVDSSKNPTANSFSNGNAEALAGSISINNGTLQFDRPAGGDGISGIVRGSAMEGPPQDVVCVSFNIRFPDGSPDTFKTLGSVLMGYFLGGNEAENIGGHTLRNMELFIRGRGENEFRLQVANGENSSSVSSIGSAKSVAWFINSGDTTRSYLAPDGSTQTVASNRSDIWLEGNLVLDEQDKPGNYRSRNLSYFRIYSNTDQEVRFQIDDFRVSDFQESSAYGDWLSSHFDIVDLPNPEMAAPLADLDLDGLSTLLEFALNSNPTQPSIEALPEITQNEDQLTMTFTRRFPTQVEYRIQASEDLSANSWVDIATLTSSSNAWSGSAQVSESGTGNTRQVTIEPAAATPSFQPRYLRLAVNLPSP